ncbi:N-carbamoylsarcosine amidase [Castellaniella defragrans 65Phen]|uniref:N-carbamoylsarcosine amidase n=1 Tax=Castellaniella defragrans (strain DSM 12143 / CCUG 39792 / 65Phen) TaxID=1437824 RepID=W8X2R0_CASD6|nr:isochorismatase family protein [Castellaniella defragrans]CDM23697.1 N-carbamoylsarcosine amidase [Castellaniella defragrans 65Phen]
MNEMVHADEKFFRERGFGLKIGFGQRPGLVIVDIIQAFTDPDMPLGSNMDAEIEAANRLIDACREAGVPVFFTTTAYDDASLRDGGIWVLKQKGAATLRSGTAAVELDPRLHHQPQDSILVKKYASCFFGTDLLSRLVSNGCDTVLIAGCTTSGCVRGTAVDAVQNGFRPIIVAEAVGDRSEAAHRQSLFDLQAKYCDVVALEEALDYLRTIRPRAA